MKLIVKHDDKLLNYLYNNLELSKKKIKSYLVHGLIYVNNVKTTQYDYSIAKGMSIVIDTKKPNYLPFKIIYEDDYIIVVDKPSGLLTIATNKETEKTLYHYVGQYLKNKNKNNKVFIVHRLDKDTSGIVLFAKDQKTKNQLQKDWSKFVKLRQYKAIVHGRLKQKKEKLINNLLETKTNYVYINKIKGKQAITNYEVIAENDNYSLLNIVIETGRKNQIRVQLAHINHPIVGDLKYGKKENKTSRLYLHADKLTLFYPILKKELTLTSQIPNEFNKIIK